MLMARLKAMVRAERRDDDFQRRVARFMMFPSSNEVLEFPVTETRPLLFLCDPGQHVLPGRDKRVGSHERALYCIYSKSIHSEAQGKPSGEGIPAFIRVRSLWDFPGPDRRKL